MNILKFFKRVKDLITGLSSISERIEDLQEAVGRIETRQIKLEASNDIHDYEFKVFSQCGED